MKKESTHESDAELTGLLKEVRSLKKELDLLKENPAIKNTMPEYSVLVKPGVDFRPEYEVAVRIGHHLPPDYAVAVRVPIKDVGER